MTESEQNSLHEIRPEDSLLETVGSDDLAALAIDFWEPILDKMVEDGPIREIPIIGSVLRIAKLGLDVTNYLFIKKVVRFLYHLQEIPLSERQKFLAELNKDESYRQRVGEQLLLSLHRLDDMQKPELLSRVFSAFIRGEIDFVTYRKLCTAIDRMKMYHMQSLVDFYEEPPDRKVAADETLQDLAFAGLVNIMVVKGMSVGPLDGFTQNDLGRLFIQLVMRG
jgi:hypothetical protein